MIAILREALPEVVAILIVGFLGLIYRQYLHKQLPTWWQNNLARLAPSIKLVTSNRAFWPAAGLILLLAVLFFYRPPEIPPAPSPNPGAIRKLCAIEQDQDVEFVDGPAAASDILGFFANTNPTLFDRLDELEQIFLDARPHRGITYIWGSPGVGKSFISRNRLNELFPGTSCLIKLGDLDELPPEVLGFEVLYRPDLSTVDGAQSFDSLIAVSQARDYRLEKLFAGAGCKQGGQDVAFTAIGDVDLILVDDIDEVHSETTNLVLESLDEFMLDKGQSADDFVHVVVFGRSEGYATWYWDPKRNEDIVEFLEVFNLRGPRYQSYGDLEILADNQGEFINGTETWNRMKQDGTAAEWAANFVQYVSQHPVASYSVGTLTIATMVSDRAQAGIDDTELELMAFIFEELLRRAERVHGRPLSSEVEYLYLLEEIAVRYQNQIDEEGYFRVGINDTVKTSAEGQAEVSVRDALAHSGIAIINLPTSSIARYRFEPVWVHRYLLELRNQRLNSAHVVQTCQG